MNKFVFLAGILGSSIVLANHCPPPEMLFVKQGNEYVTLTPAGWQWTSSWGGKPQFTSSDVQLNWAMWSSNRINSEDENRVHCVYGNPTFDGSTSSGILQTVDLIDRSQVEDKPNWRKFSVDYFRCEKSDVFQCLFG